MDKPNQENEPDQGSPAPSVPTIGVTLAPPSSSASSSSAAAADPQPAQTLAYKPSIASIPESTTDSIGPYAPYGGTISAKPSFASFSSSRGLLGASAPFAGHSVTAKPSLADLPESPKSPQETPAQSWPFPKPAAPGAAQPQTQPKPWAPAAAAAAAAKPAVAGGKPGQGQAAPETTKEEYKKKASTFFRIFSYSTTKERVFLAGATFASIASGCTMPFVTIVFGRLVATVTTYYTPGMTEKQAQDGFSNAINECVIYMLYIFAARFVLGYLASLGFRMISLRISATIRLAYMTALLGRPISGLDAVPPGQTAAIITNSANVMQLGISERLSSFISALSLIICALVIAFIHHWKLTLVTSSGLVLICICYGVTIPMVVKIMKKVQESEIRASAVASEAFASVRMIAACGAEDKMAERFAACSDESRRRGLKMAKVVAVQQAVVFFTVFATFALTFWFAVKLYLNYEINSIGTLIVVLMSVMMIVMSIGSIAGPLSAAARASAAAGILFLMIDLPPRNIGGLKEPDVTATGAILLTNVNFTYPMRPDVKVLDGLTLRIPAGKITAIVGPSGSGKSTIVGLIERWYELDGDFGANMAVLFFRNGQITTGGKSLKDIDLKWWRSQIGLVQQEPFLFNDTILRNVQYGLVGTQWENESEDKKKELAEQACKEAFADEFIARLPDGYNTRVGDAGIKLSGGQRQRLAIARAIIRQPKILILDEATSAIDVRGEQIVQAALDRASKNRTTITIAHRLSTIKKADNIVVLNKGKVVQQGTHESLMQTVGGAYWTLATSQQLSMDEEHPEGSEVGEKQQSMDIMESEGTGGAVKTQGDWKTKGFLRSFGTLIIEQRKHWYWYIFLVFGAVVAGGSAPVQAFLFAKLITGFYFVGDLLRDWINFWCLMFTVLACAVGIGYFSLGWAATTLAFDISSTYRKEYFRNIISKSIAFFDEERHSIGGLTAVIASDPQQLQQLLGTNMGFALVAVLNVTGCLTISFYFGWKLTAVALSCSLPIILAAGFFRIRHETQFEAMNRKVFAASATFATEAVGACRTVATLGLEDHILKTYRGLLGDHVEEAWRKSRWSNLVFAGSDAMPLLCMAFVLWYGGKLLASGEYNQFQYLVVYIAVVQGGIGAGQWLSFGPNIAQATAAANRILAMRRKDDSGGQPLPRDSTDVEDDEKGGVRIEFSNVWFRYPTRDAPVLNGLNLTIEKGQFAAVVGASGAGKTSVISLLERFYKIKSGSITYNNTDIYSLSLSDYRSTVSLVAQEPSLFTGTIRANILVGLPSDPPVPDSVLHAVCVEAEIHDFIVSLPEGYDTMVGLKGVALSGGQKQRIAIARALIRRPKLLLLDEATSNLDSGTEKSLQGVFERAKGGMTMVVVAHRLATVQNADVIFVLGDGTVLESGSHAALLAKRGVYYHMCLSQALDR